MAAFVVLAILFVLVLVMVRIGALRAPEPPLPLSERSEVYRALPWSNAAAALGLMTRGRAEPTELVGEIDGFPVRVWKGTDADRDGPDDDFTAFEVDAAGTLGTTHIRGDAGVQRFLLGQDFETGDPTFDDEIRLYVENQDLMRAVLDHNTRERIFELVTTHHGRMSTNVLRDEVDRHINETDQLVEHTRWLVDLAKRLNPVPEEIPTQLSEIAIGDPEGGVRLHALRTAQKLFPREESTTELYQNLVRTAANDQVTAEAAYALGERGVAKLRDVFANGKSTDAREVALRGIVEHVEPDDAAHLALQGLNSGLRVASARALRRLGRVEDEPHLIALLDDDESEVQLAAIEALGEFGTLAAVEPLLPLTRGVLRSAGLKDAARTSVAAIQARHARGDVGTVALVESASAGGVALASEIEVGAVSEAVAESTVDGE